MIGDWIPGVLSRRQVIELAGEGYITGLVEEAVDPSAIDLHLSDTAYELPNGSVKPFGGRYLHLIERDKLVKRYEPVDGIFLLERKKTYLFRLREALNLRELNREIHGQATAKSSVGRVDVLARLIVDGMSDYERFDRDAADKGNGQMFVEITPITFSVRVRVGDSVNQLRLFLGSPEGVEIQSQELYKTCLRGENPFLSVDLSPAMIGGLPASAFATSSEETSAPIDLWERKPRNSPELPDPCHYWRFLEWNEHHRLTITKDEFYILRSREEIALPSGVAVYCRASDETIGEMRIHYAGFVHPWFGRTREDGKIGTPLIFEVRGHNVNVSLFHEERMARLIFYRMSEDAEKPEEKTPYNNQTLQLSKFFREWPDKLTRIDDHGRVTAAE